MPTIPRKTTNEINWDEAKMSIEREATVNATIRGLRPSEDMLVFPCLKFEHESTNCCGAHAPFILIEAKGD